MGDAIVRVILERGGLTGAIALLCLFVAAWLFRRYEAERAVLNKRIDDLQAARVADAQKTRDEVVALHRPLIEAMEGNRHANNATTVALTRLADAITDGDPPPPPEADRTARRRPTRP